MATPERTLDELLVLRAQEGSEKAFRMLVDRLQPRLWRHAFCLTGRSEAASDVVQEAWLGVVRGLGRLRDPSSFRPWVYTIVTRKSAEWQRGPGRVEDRERALDVEPMAEPEAISTASDLLREAMRKLPRERQVLLTLRYLEEFELTEIAAILHIPEGTVKSRLHHARDELRQILERNDHE